MVKVGWELGALKALVRTLRILWKNLAASFDLHWFPILPLSELPLPSSLAISFLPPSLNASSERSLTERPRVSLFSPAILLSLNRAFPFLRWRSILLIRIALFCRSLCFVGEVWRLINRFFVLLLLLLVWEQGRCQERESQIKPASRSLPSSNPFAASVSSLKKENLLRDNSQRA